MFKKLLLTIAVLLPFVASAQDFPGRNPEILIGTKVKPITKNEKLQPYGYDNFYSSTDFTSKNRLFLNDKKTSSVYESLVNKTFEVIDVKKESVYDYIILENKELGKVYYKYSKFYKHSFELEIIDFSGITKERLCNSDFISKYVDKFDGKTTYRAKINDYDSIVKEITKEGQVSIFLSLSARSSTYVAGMEGIKLLFEDTTQLEFPTTKISSIVSRDGGYLFSIYHKLNDKDIEILKTKVITDYRMYHMDITFSKLDGVKLKYLLDCIENYNN